MGTFSCTDTWQLAKVYSESVHRTYCTAVDKQEPVERRGGGGFRTRQKARGTLLFHSVIYNSVVTAKEYEHLEGKRGEGGRFFTQIEPN